MAYPADPDTYLNPLKAKVYNDVVDNDESRLLNRFNLFIDHDFGWADFRSSTSWTKFDTNNREDEDGTNLKPYIYFDTANIEKNESWYQEFKFSHSDETFDWVAGASYYSEDAKQTSDTHTYTDSVDTVLVNTGQAPAPGLFGITDFLYNAVYLPYAASLGADLPPLSLANQTWEEAMYNHGEYSATAVFGDVIWHATDRMNLTVGLRYTSDDKHFSWLNGPRVSVRRGYDACRDGGVRILRLPGGGQRNGPVGAGANPGRLPVRPGVPEQSRDRGAEDQGPRHLERPEPAFRYRLQAQ